MESSPGVLEDHINCSSVAITLSALSGEQLCQDSFSSYPCLISLFSSLLSRFNPPLVSLILRQLLEDNDDLRVIFLIRYSNVVADHDDGNDELSNIKLRRVIPDDQSKMSKNYVRDPRGTVTHDGHPRSKHQLQMDSFCSNLLDDLVKVPTFTNLTPVDIMGFK